MTPPARDGSLLISVVARRPPADLWCVPVTMPGFLLIPGWEDELRGNRWHFAVRWAKLKPDDDTDPPVSRTTINRIYQNYLKTRSSK